MGSEEFENRLRERRNAAGLTQVELGRRAGITRQSLIHLESGKFVASTTVALRLARALGCAVEDLFSLPEPKAARLRADLAQPFSPARRVDEAVFCSVSSKADGSHIDSTVRRRSRSSRTASSPHRMGRARRSSTSRRSVPSRRCVAT
jgi:putative transcriptional regulator